MRAVLVQVPAGQTYAQVADPEVDVHEAAVASIEAARVRRFIDWLPEIERRVIRWRYGIDCDQLTLREIAGRLGMGKSTVGDIEQRALARLRGAYGISRRDAAVA